LAIAYTFTIRSRERGQVLGQAIVCAGARYASVMRTTSPYPGRRFTNAMHWSDVERQLGGSLAAPLTGSSAIARLLAGEQAPGLSLHYLSHERLPEGMPEAQVVEHLDEQLRLTGDQIEKTAQRPNEVSDLIGMAGSEPTIP